MMHALKSFIRTSLLGGIIVVLPVAILFILVQWACGFIATAINPLTTYLLSKSEMATVLAQILAAGVILLACFLIGVLIKTRVGQFIHGRLERDFLNRIPGYTIVRETVLQFIGNTESPFSSVALAQIFGNDTLVTAFVTDKHEDGMMTVFVPTGPNPTSGNIYHLEGKYVHPVDLPVEEVMRSIISCGAGSKALVQSYRNSSRSPESSQE